jgi:hypothetical protein
MISYKYAGESGIRILEGLRVKITPPNEFNDSFEITPLSKRARPLAEMLADASKDSKFFQGVYSDMVGDGKYVGSFDQFRRDMRTELPKRHADYRKLSKLEMAKRDMTTLEEVSSNLGILCLTNLPNSIPMWSYYANHHRGVVFGIEIEEIVGQLPGPRGFVKYRKHRVRYNPFGADAQQQRLKTVFSKSSEWNHEQEYRCVFRLSDLICSLTGKNEGKRFYFLDISGTAIREIILGCRVDPELEQQVRSEIARRKRTFEHVRLLRCERHKSKFALRILPAN